MQLPIDTRGASGDAISAEPIELRGVADVNGSCVLTLPAVPQGRRWLVNYVTVTADGLGQPPLVLLIDGSELFDGTDDASAAVASYAPPRVLTQGQTLSAEWAGVTPGGQCTLRFEYDMQAI